MLVMVMGLPLISNAQDQWSFVDMDSWYRRVLDIAFISDGSMVGVYHTIPHDGLIGRVGAYKFDAEGVLLRDTLFQFGTIGMLPQAIPTQPADHFRVVGFGSNTAELDGRTAFQYTAWMNPDLVIDSLKTIPLPYDYCAGQFVGMVGPDRQIQPLQCRIYSESSSPNHHVLLETNVNGDSISSRTYTFTPGSTSFMFDVAGLDGGGIMVSAWGTPWPVGQSIIGKAIYFDDALEFVQAQAMNHAVTPTNMNTAPYSNVDLLKLPSGNILVGGRYRLDQGGSFRSALQMVDQELNLLQQFTPASTHALDHVALSQCLDTTPDGHILFGHMERFDPLSPEVLLPWPDVVRIYKLDTDFNVLCEYVVDGFADSTYYTLYRVKATPDGGAVALGSALDLTIPDAPPRAWVRRFAPSECVSTGMPPQHAEGQLLLYPNPGHEGFQLVLPAGMHMPELHVFDATGRLVYRTTYQAGGRVDTSLWPSGVYAVVLRHPGHGSWSARWIKQ